MKGFLKQKELRESLKQRIINLGIINISFSVENENREKFIILKHRCSAECQIGLVSLLTLQTAFLGTK